MVGWWSLESVEPWNCSAKTWNECRKTVEVPREIRRPPSTIYTHPTANLVPGNFNEHVGYTTLWVWCCSLTSGSLESLLNVNLHSHPVSFHVQARQAKNQRKKQKCQKSSFFAFLVLIPWFSTGSMVSQIPRFATYHNLYPEPWILASPWWTSSSNGLS
jgi:hypothetical protein